MEASNCAGTGFLPAGVHVEQPGSYLLNSGFMRELRSVRGSMVLFFAQNLENVNEEIDNIIEQGHGSIYIVFFVHLVLGMLACYNQFGVMRQVKGKESCTTRTVHCIRQGQKPFGDESNDFKELK